MKDSFQALAKVSAAHLFAAICITATTAATAQTAAENSDTALQEVVVTALKRDTALQDTPIAISAITGDALSNSGVQGIGDLAASVPSLNIVDAGPSFRRVVIRGIQAAGEPTVGTYYDETPVTGSIGSTNDAGGSTPELRLFDVERVEVLRGPQGTLYGSGSMGGTLRVIYKKPTFEQEIATDTALSGTEGGGFNYEVNGVFNTPIVDDKAAARIVGFYGKRNGFIDEVALGIDDINDIRSYGGRGQLRLTPGSNLTIDLAAFLNRARTDSPSWTFGAGDYNTDALTRQPVRDDLDLYSVTAVWEPGPVNVTGVVSYLKRDLSNVSDVSRFIRSMRTAANCARLSNGNVPCNATQLNGFYALVDSQSTSVLFPQQDMNTTTAELRVSSNDAAPLNWTVGAFYSARETDVANPQVNADPVTGAVIEPQQVATVRFIDDDLKQYAGFGELSWDATERLNLTAGTRYFNYTKDIVGETTVGSILVGARVTPPTAVSSDESGWVMKLNASFKVTDDVLLYTEAAEGFRPGGANQVLGLPTALTPYESDSLWNYEVGVKSTLFDRRLMFDFDVFQIDWENIQVTGRTPNGAFSFITNAGAARVRGVEAEATARPASGLSLNANITYTDAELTENQTNNNVTAPGLAGDRIPYVPRLTAGLGAQYEWPLKNGLSGFARVDANHVGSSYSDFRPNATFTREVDSYELVNLRIGGTSADDRWSAYVFCSNVFNDIAIVRATSSAIQTGRTIVNSAPPRTIGINVRTQF
jgi:outer membrane receptor protein involved in Fe transport